MDFMKVFDQAVREIKREVNLKVLKVPEIEQKVLDATDDEPWGPHGTVLAEIADATKRFTDCQMVMNVLWTRLTETDKNWRLVYKALAVIEYLVGHGSERAVDDIIEHTFQISSLASFEYVEPSGKDLGINVRKKAEAIVVLLNDKDKIQEVRNKAAANREKYFGLSSSGITYKSGAASFSNSNFRNSSRYGGFGSAGDNSSFGDTYNVNDRHSESKYENTNKSKREPSRHESKKQDPVGGGASKPSKSKPDSYGLASSQNSLSDKYNEEFDDFDPRGTSTAKPSSGSNQVDLFGQSIVGDLLDAPASAPTDMASSLDNDSSEVDLFADAAFVSATPEPEAETVSAPQANIYLFVSASAPTVSTTVDLFAKPDPVPQPNNNTSSISDPTSSNSIDPFAAVPLNNFEGSDPFGAFTSNTDPLTTESGKGHEGNSGSANGYSIETKSPPKKDAFQVKSGIWADSLNRGLIDLNITAPKKVNLADVGVVGGLSDGSEEKGPLPLPSLYSVGSMRGGSMAIGSGGVGGKSGFRSTAMISDDDFFSSLSNQQNQFGSFQK